MRELKLLLRKAIFSGKTFLGHSNKIGELLDNYTDKELEDFFKQDIDLLEEWENLREDLGIKV